MKEYKVLHVQEEHPRKLTEGNWHSAHDHLWAEEVLKLYSNYDYRVVHMVPDIAPAPSGDRPHHLHGYTFLLEREICRHNHKIAPAEVDGINALTPGDYPHLTARRLDGDPDFCSLLRLNHDPHAPRDYHDLELERLELERDLDFQIFFELNSDEEDNDSESSEP